MPYRLHTQFDWQLAGALAMAACLGCVPDMADQPRYEPLEESAFFDDGMSARPRVEGTVARGELYLDSHFYRGTVNGESADTLPVELDERLLLRGQERFNIFCSHCHDKVGSGRGMVVQRGFPQPPSYHIERLRVAPVGQIFDVITNGRGRMPEHGTLLAHEDRWAIVAYVRTLQLSQYANASLLSDDEQAQLQGANP
jgi:mono/diheme cytochrome c family protein